MLGPQKCTSIELGTLKGQPDQLQKGDLLEKHLGALVDSWWCCKLSIAMNRKQELVRNWMIPKHLKTLHHSDCQHHPAGDSSSLAHGSFMLAAKKGRWIGYLPRPLSLWLFSLISSPPSQSMSSTISKKSSSYWLDLKCYWWPLAVSLDLDLTYS